MCKFGYKYDEFEEYAQQMIDYENSLFQKNKIDNSLTRFESQNQKILDKCLLIFGDKYDYSYWDLNKGAKEIRVLCKKHGLFTIDKYLHSNGRKCRQCFLDDKKKQSFDEFVEKANILYNSKFTYFEDTFVGSTFYMKAECPEHGIFDLIPSNHLFAGVHCLMCKGYKSNERKKSDKKCKKCE